MAAPALKKEGVDGRVNHPIKSGDGHDGVDGSSAMMVRIKKDSSEKTRGCPASAFAKVTARQVAAPVIAVLRVRWGEWWATRRWR
jgi:hypothetical protein